MLGVQIANGFSPEARVHAQLLGNRGDFFDAKVIMHDSPADRSSAVQFATASRADVSTVDTGWREEAGANKIAARAAFLFRFAGAINEITKRARDFNPDVIYSCQQQWDCRAATVVARKLGKPQVIHLHYILGPWLRKQPLERLLTCDHVITVSEYIRKEALRHGVASGRVTTLLNSAPKQAQPAPGAREAIRAGLGVSPEAPLIGIVSRIRPFEGHEDTIEAFGIASRRFPDARLVVLGDGSSEMDIRDFAAGSGASDRITFTGRRSDVPAILAALDIFIHPSQIEPCAVSLIEASLAGLPVVAYADGGTPELVIDGVTGLLAPVDDRAALAGALERLLDNPELGRSYGSAGRERMQTSFRPEQASEAFAGLLTSVITGSGKK